MPSKSKRAARQFNARPGASPAGRFRVLVGRLASKWAPGGEVRLAARWGAWRRDGCVVVAYKV